MTEETAVLDAPLQDKFDELRAAMRLEFVERDNQIDALFLSWVAMQHVFLVGPPGVAKSLVFRSARNKISGLTTEEYFEILMMKSTTPEEVFGPPSIAELKKGNYIRVTEGYLPVAKFAFFDEVFKANSAILNGMLMAFNERKFRNGGSVLDIPLHTMGCASNELPEGEELDALYDRILIRVPVDPIRQSGNLHKIVQASLTGHHRDPNHKYIAWEDIQRAHAEAQQVTVPDDVIQALIEVKLDLASENEIIVTDRRVVQAFSVVQASAWLNRRKTADIEDLRPLRYVLWNQPNEFPVVESKMIGLANPMDQEAMKIREIIDEKMAQVERDGRDDMDGDTKQAKGVQMHDKTKQIRQELTDLKKQMAEGNRSSSLLEEIIKENKHLTKRTLNVYFDVPDSMIEAAEEE